MLGLAVASLVAAATLLAVTALGILLIMLRLSRQYDGSPHHRLTAGAAADIDDDDEVKSLAQLRATRTCSAVNVTVNPVDQLLLLHRQKGASVERFDAASSNVAGEERCAVD